MLQSIVEVVLIAVVSRERGYSVWSKLCIEKILQVI